MTRDEARFWSKVIKGPRENDCWLWVRAVADDGTAGSISTATDERRPSVRIASPFIWHTALTWTDSGR